MEPYEIASALLGATMFLYTTRELIRRKISLPQYCIWALVWLTLIFIGLVPQFYFAVLRVTQVLGMLTPIHFVTTFSILLLFVVTYFLGRRIAELSEKVNTITQHIALQNADNKIPQSRKKEE